MNPAFIVRMRGGESVKAMVFVRVAGRMRYWDFFLYRSKKALRKKVNFVLVYALYAALAVDALYLPGAPISISNAG
ncbi:MAG: hypothetical protein AAF757_31325 [Cyanobacteria bacterium P01_D01_bin.116]